MTSTMDAIDSRTRCIVCHHDADDHELVGKGLPPKWGMLVCPVPNCTCKRSWGVSPRPNTETGRWADLSRAIVAAEEITAEDHPKTSFLLGFLTGMVQRSETNGWLDLQMDWEGLNFYLKELL